LLPLRTDPFPLQLTLHPARPHHRGSTPTPTQTFKQPLQVGDKFKPNQFNHQDAVGDIRYYRSPAPVEDLQFLTRLRSLTRTPHCVQHSRLHGGPTRTPLHHNKRISYPRHSPQSRHVLILRRPLTFGSPPATKCRPLHHPSTIP
jgi:hypothetical protein